jgi:hypothetical protein
MEYYLELAYLIFYLIIQIDCEVTQLNYLMYHYSVDLHHHQELLIAISINLLLNLLFLENH